LLSAEFIAIANNAAHERLPELESLTRLSALIVHDNPVLENVPTFPGVLRDFEGLADVLELSERDLLIFRPNVIEIRNNPALTSLVLAEGWQAAGLVTIDDNAALESIAVSTIAAIDLLEIANNPALQSVDIGALATVDDLRVSNNPSLDLAAFDPVLTFERALSSGPAESP
jgi:hypothetical protein